MLNGIAAAIVTRLGSDATLTTLLDGAGRVYELVAPQEVEPPYLIFQSQADATQTDDPQRKEDETVLIKCVSGVSMASARTVAARVDALMDNNPLTVTGLRNLWLRRTEGVGYVEDDPAGPRYWHNGALYRMRWARDG